jgi:ArsR family transcriptional regulator, arsenate/arsenite/antimonite-responsive transcriptional repressor
MEAQQVVTALSAIAHEHRLAVYRMLVEAGPQGLPAGTLAERLGMPPSSLSFHLKQLHYAGLVTQRRLSRQLIYAADFSVMNGLISYLTENCCGGAGCAPALEPAVTTTSGKGRKQRRSA